MRAILLRAAAGNGEDIQVLTSLEGELADGAAGEDADPYQVLAVLEGIGFDLCAPVGDVHDLGVNALEGVLLDQSDVGGQGEVRGAEVRLFGEAQLAAISADDYQRAVVAGEIRRRCPCRSLRFPLCRRRCPRRSLRQQRSRCRH